MFQHRASIFEKLRAASRTLARLALTLRASLPRASTDKNADGNRKDRRVARAATAPLAATPLAAAKATSIRHFFSRIDWAPDLGADLGSVQWWRGLATIALLCCGAVASFPGVEPIMAIETAPQGRAVFHEARAQMIAPLALGSDSGRRMVATDAVRLLEHVPERPQIELTATMGRGDSFSRVLQRAGVSRTQATLLTDKLSSVVAVEDIAPGTRIHMILGRRKERTMPRPIEVLDMRVRFDLRIEMENIADRLVIRRLPIAVDDTPLRIQGRVGRSLYRTARAAGAPASAVQAYLRAVGRKISISRDIRASDQFDIIVEQRRAETGETEIGKLLYAGLARGGKSKVSMIEWTSDGQRQWFEHSGTSQPSGGAIRPTTGKISSRYGMRRHPILGYRRMHRGIDFSGRHGAPIRAISKGIVRFAGRNGGYGKFVRLEHSGGLGSGYGHMSRIAVSRGQRVSRGQLIGYMGSTGLSTGPHLHHEIYRNGRKVDPKSVNFAVQTRLTGRELARFRARIGELTSVPSAAALALSTPELTPQAPRRTKLVSLAEITKKRASEEL